VLSTEGILADLVCKEPATESEAGLGFTLDGRGNPPAYASREEEKRIMKREAWRKG